MNNPKIAEYFFDNFEQILDELYVMNHVKDVTLTENDSDFHQVINDQFMDEYIRSVSISCATKLGLSYAEVFDALEDKLSELYNAFE